MTRFPEGANQWHLGHAANLRETAEWEGRAAEGTGAISGAHQDSLKVHRK